MTYLILGLATWRLTSLIIREDGPWDCLARLRMWLGVYYDEQSVAQGRNVIAKALTCVWCTSLWVGLFMTVLLILFKTTAVLLATPFALSTIAITIERWVDGTG